MQKIRLLSPILFLLVFFSCSNSNEQKKAAKEIDNVEVSDIVNSTDKTHIPSAYEIIQMLNESGAGYVYDITNPPENIDKYLSYKQKAINLGVYAADLVYTTTYQKKDETASYLDNFVQLVGDLDINTLNDKFFQRVQDNLNNKDSLVIIVKQAQDDTQDFLNKSGKEDLANYALIGSWVEGMYLVETSIKFAENKDAIQNIIIKNRGSLKNLLKLLENKKKDENFKDLYDSLSKIDKLYKKMENQNNEKAATQLKEELINLRNSII